MSPEIIPNELAVVRLVSAVLLAQNDTRQRPHLYLQLEAMAEMLVPPADEQATPRPSKSA